MKGKKGEYKEYKQTSSDLHYDFHKNNKKEVKF